MMPLSAKDKTKFMQQIILEPDGQMDVDQQPFRHVCRPIVRVVQEQVMSTTLDVR